MYVYIATSSFILCMHGRQCIQQCGMGIREEGQVDWAGGWPALPASWSWHDEVMRLLACPVWGWQVVMVQHQRKGQHRDYLLPSCRPLVVDDHTVDR